MIISTTRSKRRPGARDAGFTLVEIIIGSTLSSFVLVGVLSAFLMLGRSGMNVANYSMSEAEVRRALEEFSQDVRMASGVTWNSTTSVTLTVPNNYTTSSNRVTYGYDNLTTGDTAQCFYRVPGTGGAPVADRTILVRNVASLQFERYNRLDNAASGNSDTKRLQLTLNVRRTGRTLVDTNTALVSASYTLRNKVTQ